MKTKASVVLVLLCGALLVAGASGSMAATQKATGDDEVCYIDVREVPRMSVDELKSRLNDPSLLLIDVRAGGDWNGSSTKIKGAVREVYEKTEEWASKYDKDKTIVLYCA
jgi:rhodanese-related sulfurtransferase